MQLSVKEEESAVPRPSPFTWWRTIAMKRNFHEQSRRNNKNKKRDTRTLLFLLPRRRRGVCCSTKAVQNFLRFQKQRRDPQQIRTTITINTTTVSFPSSDAAQEMTVQLRRGCVLESTHQLHHLLLLLLQRHPEMQTWQQTLERTREKRMWSWCTIACSTSGDFGGNEILGIPPFEKPQQQQQQRVDTDTNLFCSTHTAHERWRNKNCNETKKNSKEKLMLTDFLLQFSDFTSYSCSFHSFITRQSKLKEGTNNQGNQRQGAQFIFCFACNFSFRESVCVCVSCSFHSSPFLYSPPYYCPLLFSIPHLPPKKTRNACVPRSVFSPL